VRGKKRISNMGKRTTTTQADRPSPHTRRAIAVAAIVGDVTVEHYFDPRRRPRMQRLTVERIEDALRRLGWEPLIRSAEQGAA